MEPESPFDADNPTPDSVDAGPLPPAAMASALRLVVPALALTALLVAAGAYLVRPGSGGGAEVPGTGGELIGFALDPPRAAPAFTLTDHTGAPWSLADARGKAVLLFFGFTSCPDVCPTTLLTMAHALESLGAQADQVEPLFVSIDPERDSPSVLAGYVAGYDPRIVGATSDLATLGAMAEDYGVQFQKAFPEGASETGGNYTMDHSATIFLIDPEGRLRAAYLDPTPDELAHDLRVVLAQ